MRHSQPITADLSICAKMTPPAPSSLCSPVASAAASFNTLDDVANDDESGGVGTAGISDLCVPSTAIGAVSLSANPSRRSASGARRAFHHCWGSLLLRQSHRGRSTSGAQRAFHYPRDSLLLC